MKAREKVALDLFRPGPTPTVSVRGSGLCAQNDRDCGCVSICPAGAFKVVGSGRRQRVVVRSDRCLECGACLYACPEGMIDFEYPGGGFGIVHRYG